MRHKVLVVGAGPVGLATAIDLAQQGVQVVLLDDDDVLSSGSRAICFAKRTLEIFDRLGCGDRMVEKGVSWNVGKVFFRDELVYSFNLLPEAGHHRPAFINLQQYYVEGFLLERAQQLQNIDIRWKNKVSGLVRKPEMIELLVDTPDGEYTLEARLRDRLRRRAQPDSRVARPGEQGPDLPRPLPDRRRQDDGGFPDRALVLVRSAVPSQPVGAAAPSARQRLAHRFPARLGRRSRRGAAA